MKYTLVYMGILLSPLLHAQKSIEQRVDSVLKLMTLDEKVGQLNQYSGDWAHTGPITKEGDKQKQIREGKLGSLLNVIGVQHTREIQEMAMQSRLKIPLLFGQDVIHGFKTTFPIPLAEAASWDVGAIELSARIAATEAAASGIHWTFAPMVDIGRDPRWGRVMEGAGEDTYLGSKIAVARVKGFQGKGLGNVDAVMACAKHFAAYGAAVGGRDYNSVDMSMRMLNDVFLPPFHAAVEAGVATVMNAFNDLNGVPATANEYLLKEVLLQRWKFNGFVVSDWNSIGEMINHGYAKNRYEAGRAAINAGSHMDMESRVYRDELAKLVKDGKVSQATLDDAVRKILTKKFQMGLFDDPFRFCDAKREQAQLNNPNHRLAARDMAKKSIVLLKNKDQLLPLDKKIKTIAMIGPFVKAVRDNLGFWSMEWPDDSSTIVTQWAGVQKKLTTDTRLLYAKGCDIKDSSKAGFEEALNVAAQADVIILSVGEARNMSGEAKSRSSLQLPGVQEELIKLIYATSKPVVVMINAGRPLIFNWTADNVHAILYTWWLGTEAGNAIADVLFGDYNPAAKLPMTFPRTEGQIPIYYNHFNTGRPARDENHVNYVSAYIDLPNSPKFPFGYGLSYTSFSYGDITLDKKEFDRGSITASVTITNTGKYAGEEVVQLYIRDMAGLAIRPVKELKGFQKIVLQPGESKQVSFKIGAEDLAFYYEKDKRYITEPGDFKLFIGTNSRDVKETTFRML